MAIDSKKIKVFVYGSLMSKLKRRHHPTAAKVENHQILFNLKGVPKWEPSFAVLTPAQSQIAWGVVASLTEAEWRNYRKHEISYSETSLVAISADGTRHACIALTRGKGNRFTKSEIIPSARYAKKLLRPAKLLGLPKEVIEKYETFSRKGSRRTLYLGLLEPFVEKLVPYVGLKAAFLLTVASVFVALVLLVILIISTL